MCIRDRYVTTKTKEAKSMRIGTNTDNRRKMVQDIAEFTGEELHYVGPVSYTHLDVYKRQCTVRNTSLCTNTIGRPPVRKDTGAAGRRRGLCTCSP